MYVCTTYERDQLREQESRWQSFSLKESQQTQEGSQEEASLTQERIGLLC
jgi:hypothetical protein